MIQINDSDTPITVAQKLIHSTKTVGTTPLMTLGAALGLRPVPEPGAQIEVDMFSDAEIREIAEYLLTYSKYHEEDEA
jgi:hypothetical protein